MGESDGRSRIGLEDEALRFARAQLEVRLKYPAEVSSKQLGI